SVSVGTEVTVAPRSCSIVQSVPSGSDGPNPSRHGVAIGGQTSSEGSPNAVSGLGSICCSQPTNSAGSMKGNGSPSDHPSPSDSITAAASSSVGGTEDACASGSAPAREKPTGSAAGTGSTSLTVAESSA